MKWRCPGVIASTVLEFKRNISVSDMCLGFIANGWPLKLWEQMIPGGENAVLIDLWGVGHSLLFRHLSSCERKGAQSVTSVF